MPVKISGSEYDLRFLKCSVESIKQQTDDNWILVIVDDFSDNEKVSEALDEIGKELGEKAHIIHLEKNVGSGMARNEGVRYANEIGAPFILFNDSDDLSHPRRLELVRKAFEDDDANVVYTSFDVINENDEIVPLEKVSPTVREIINGHKKDAVEGENAWISIASKKKYTNLTSCTAVRTSLAAQEPFPASSVSEDCHTWFRYAAHPGRYVFLREIKNRYRICSGVQSRSRSKHSDFYEQMYKMDSDGFEQAVIRAKKYGTMGGLEENVIRAAFHVRIALTLLHAESERLCRESLAVASEISRIKTLECIDLLDCEPGEKEKMKQLL